MTSNVFLRDVAQEDIPIFFEHQRDPDAGRMAAFPARERDAHAAHWAKILGADSVTKKTIVADGRVAGNIVSFDQSGRQMVATGSGRTNGGKASARRRSRPFWIRSGYVRCTHTSPSTTSPRSASSPSAASRSRRRARDRSPAKRRSKSSS
jgi:hypothetical protein